MDENRTSTAGRALAAIGAAKGGHARAASMTQEERSEAASVAARARWRDRQEIPRATHTGEMRIGPLLIPCAVLEDGRRMISQRGIVRALGSRTGAGAARAMEDGGPKLPPFLASKSIFPFIPPDLLVKVNSPIVYRTGRGGGLAHGFEASLLPHICDVWLAARDAGSLWQRQRPLAERADIIMRGLAHIGVIALVDEATGYQEDRGKNALQRILEQFIAKELLPWTKKFPDSFFEEIYRLRGWGERPETTRSPRFVGRIINAYIYERLPPGVLDELKRKNPVVNGRRKHRHHQHLTPDTGHPALNAQIIAVTTLMRLAGDWKEFTRSFVKVFPRTGDQIALALREAEQD